MTRSRKAILICLSLLVLTSGCHRRWQRVERHHSKRAALLGPILPGNAAMMGGPDCNCSTSSFSMSPPTGGIMPPATITDSPAGNPGTGPKMEQMPNPTKMPMSSSTASPSMLPVLSVR